MAKLSKIAKNEERKRLVAKYAEKRRKLKAVLANPNSLPEEIDAAGKALRKLPRDSSATRIRNRCEATGRARGYIRKFGLSRIATRAMALKGELPGVIKASW